MSTAAKGSAVERKAIKYLEAQGYAIHRTVRTGGVDEEGNFYSHANDVYGCVDIIAKKPKERTRWIQVTAHSGIGQKILDLSLIPWDTDYDSVEIWRWVGGQSRKHKTANKILYKQFFQVYFLDQKYERLPENKIFIGRKRPPTETILEQHINPAPALKEQKTNKPPAT